MHDVIISVITTAFSCKIMKLFSLNNLCPHIVCFHFIHAFELILGKYTVFSLIELY